MNKVDLTQLDSALENLECAANSLRARIRIARIQKLITLGLIKNFHPKPKTEKEICPECSTPLIIKWERGELPYTLKQSSAECPGCGYLET